MRPGRRKTVDILLTPDSTASILISIYDVLKMIDMASDYSDGPKIASAFDVRIVAESEDAVTTASGIPLVPHITIADSTAPDIVILPAMMANNQWTTGRYPALVDWLKAQHKRGAEIYSACSGVLLLAETGLLDGQNVTLHWSYARTFSRLFPAARMSLEKALVISGARNEFIMSGASASWHDLILYMIARHTEPTTAHLIAKLFALQWHQDGQLPFIVFDPPMDHGDAVILEAQTWLAKQFAVTSPVTEMVARSGLADRSFKRRFQQATGLSPIAYVQALRVADAKRWLERTDSPIDEISWKVGYEDPAFFRRLFKRLTNLTPGQYRRRFQPPGL